MNFCSLMLEKLSLRGVLSTAINFGSSTRQRIPRLTERLSVYQEYSCGKTFSSLRRVCTGSYMRNKTVLKLIMLQWAPVVRHHMLHASRITVLGTTDDSGPHSLLTNIRIVP